MATDHPEIDAGEVAHRARRGISWNVVGAVLTNAIRLVTVMVLGRALSPGDFGVVASALTVTLVLHHMRDVGIGAALIQRENIDREHVATALAFSIYLGVALGAVLVLSAPWIAAWYDLPNHLDLIRALGILFVLRGFSTVPVMLCRRAMRFRAIAIVDVITYGAGAIVAMTLAILDFGPWSLVSGYLVEDALAAVIYFALQRPPIAFRIDGHRLRELLGFGVGHTILQVANILAIQGDNFIVGGTLGPRELGFYSRAYELIKLPAAVFTNVVGNVLFPAFSRLQRDRERLAAGFRRATLVNGLVLFPASAMLIVVAPEAIWVVMGDQWDTAVLPFQILALTMMMRTSYKVGATIASASGRVYALATANIIYMVCVIAGAALTIRWGIVGVATSTAFSIMVIYLLCCALAMRVAAIAPGAVIAAHAPGLAIAVVVGGASWGIATAMRSLDAAPSVVLAFTAVAGGLLHLAAFVVWTKSMNPDADWIRAEVVRTIRKFRKAPEKRPA